MGSNPPPPPPAAAAPPAGGALPTLEALRNVTGLGGLDPDEVIGVFESAAAGAGAAAGLALDRDAFDACFRIIAKATDRPPVPGDVLAALFDLFDTDGNGVVDFAELGSGLSVLCGGNRDSKVQAAFDLYDENGDGPSNDSVGGEHFLSGWPLCVFSSLAGNNRILIPRMFLLCVAISSYGRLYFARRDDPVPVLGVQGFVFGGRGHRGEDGRRR